MTEVAEPLIRRLVSDAKPGRLAPPLFRAVVWLFSALGLVVAGMAIYGIGPDLADALHSPRFLVETALALLTAGISAAAAFSLSVPGPSRPLTRWLPLVAAGSWLGFLAFQLLSLPKPLTFHSLAGGHSCSLFILLFSVVPGLLLLWMLRRAAPVRRAWTGALGLLAVAAMASLGIQCLCLSENALHELVWHYSPILVLAAFGMVTGRRFLRW